MGIFGDILPGLGAVGDFLNARANRKAQEREGRRQREFEGKENERDRTLDRDALNIELVLQAISDQLDFQRRQQKFRAGRESIIKSRTPGKLVQARANAETVAAEGGGVALASDPEGGALSEDQLASLAPRNFIEYMASIEGQARGDFAQQFGQGVPQPTDPIEALRDRAPETAERFIPTPQGPSPTGAASPVAPRGSNA